MVGIVVENNALSGLDSLGKGMTDYGRAAASWNQYAEANGLTPEQKQAGLDKLVKVICRKAPISRKLSLTAIRMGY